MKPNLPRWEDVELVDQYVAKIEQYRNITDMEVSIIYHPDNPLNLYEGICNYSFWGPSQAGPYRSIHGCDSKEAAFEDAISGLRSYDKEEYPNEVVFFVKLKGGEVIYLDGNGDQVSLDEANERRRKYQPEE